MQKYVKVKQKNTYKKVLENKAALTIIEIQQQLYFYFLKEFAKDNLSKVMKIDLSYLGVRKIGLMYRLKR